MLTEMASEVSGTLARSGHDWGAFYVPASSRPKYDGDETRTDVSLVPASAHICYETRYSFVSYDGVRRCVS